MKIVSILFVSQLASAQLMGAPHRHLRKNASTSATATDTDFFRHLVEDASSMSMPMAQTFSEDIEKTSAQESLKGSSVSNIANDTSMLAASQPMLAMVKKGSKQGPMKDKDSKKKSGLSKSKSSKCSSRIDMDDNEDDLMWIMEHDIDLTCAEATPGVDKVRGNLCDESNDAQHWEIRQLEGAAFQIRTQSKNSNLEDLCVAVNKCEDGAPLLMTECDTCEDGPPNPKTLWYTSNVGTTNSYYCAFNVIFGMYYISPRSSYGPTDGNWKISDSAIGASVEGPEQVGMHFFWKGLPDPNPGYCTNKDDESKRDTCQDDPKSLPWSDDFSRGSGLANKVAPWTTTSDENVGIRSDTSCSDFTRSGKAMFVRGGRTAVTSPVIDTSVAADVWVRVWVKKGYYKYSCSEAPDAFDNEDLSLSYRNMHGRWLLLRGYGAGGAVGEVFEEKFLLPDANSEMFQLRFTLRDASGSNFDYWHIDDVLVTADEPTEWGNPRPVGYDTRSF